MARIIPVSMGQGNVAATTGTLMYTCGIFGNGKLGLVKSIDVCNTTTGALTISVYLVPHGATAAAANALFYTVSIAASGTYSWRGTQVLVAGGFIQAIASGTGLTINIAGGEYAP
jgi:hypothetical protein